MEYSTISFLKLSQFERILAEMFERTHKCPWYRVLFKKKCINQFEYIKNNTPIGTGITVVCKNCGESLDVTDYCAW